MLQRRRQQQRLYFHYYVILPLLVVLLLVILVVVVVVSCCCYWCSCKLQYFNYNFSKSTSSRPSVSHIHLCNWRRSLVYTWLNTVYMRRLTTLRPRRSVCSLSRRTTD